jgi:hypothetical protein
VVILIGNLRIGIARESRVPATRVPRPIHVRGAKSITNRRDGQHWQHRSVFHRPSPTAWGKRLRFSRASGSLPLAEGHGSVAHARERALTTAAPSNQRRHSLGLREASSPTTTVLGGHASMERSRSTDVKSEEGVWHPDPADAAHSTPPLLYFGSTLCKHLRPVIFASYPGWNARAE